MELMEEKNTLQALSFDDLIQQKLAIEAELDERADTELAQIKERLSLIAAYKGVEVADVMRMRKTRKPRRSREDMTEENYSA